MNAKEFLENLLTVPRISAPKISPKGDMLAYSWKNIHPNVDVFCIDLVKKSKPIVLTKTPELTIMLDFYPKSNAIIVTEDKGRNERHRLFRVNLDEPKKMIPLTEDDPDYFLRWGDIHPDEKLLFYGANYDSNKKEEIEPTWMYRHNIETNVRTVIAKPNKPAYTYPLLNKTGTHLIYTRKELHPKGTQTWFVDIDGKEDREILNFGEKARVYSDWLPDSQRVIFQTDTKDGHVQKYYSLGFYNVSSGKIEWIIDEPTRNIEYYSIPKIGNHIIVYEYEKAKVKSSIINLATMEERVLPDIIGNLVPRFPISDETWIGLYYSSTQPMNFIKFNVNNVIPEKFEFLTNLWDYTKITKEDFTPAEGFEWNGKDGLLIHGWIYRPRNPNGKTIVYIHGGPTAHSSDSINEQIQYYVNRGFFVLDPNYRGSTGYGLEFEDAIRLNGWGSDEQNDILSGIEALIDNGLAEENKVGVTGTSYGGYSSWFTITKAPKRIVAAAVPICGMTDLVIDYNTTRPDLRPYSEQMLGGNPEEVPEVYYERSPINFVQNIKGALLIVQGLRDPNVSPKNVDEVKKKLEEHSIKFDLLTFDDEGHGILKVKNQKVLFKRIADFIDEALQ